MCQTVRGPIISVARTRPIGGLYFLASVDGGREMETRRSLFRRVLRALYIMHPALRKGPPFFYKKHPLFSIFSQKAPPHFISCLRACAPTTRKSPRNNFTHDLHYSLFSICLLLLLLLGQCFTVHAVASRDISHSISYDYRLSHRIVGTLLQSAAIYYQARQFYAAF